MSLPALDKVNLFQPSLASTREDYVFVKRHILLTKGLLQAHNVPAMPGPLEQLSGTPKWNAIWLSGTPNQSKIWFVRDAEMEENLVVGDT